MKAGCISVLTFLVLFSCTRKEARDPSILPEKKMVNVMWDMLRADMYIQDFVMKDSSKNKKEESGRLYEEIFRIHKITKDQFQHSLSYYQSDPHFMQPILDSLAKKQKETFKPIPSARDSFEHLPGKKQFKKL